MPFHTHVPFSGCRCSTIGGRPPLRTRAWRTPPKRRKEIPFSLLRAKRLELLAALQAVHSPKPYSVPLQVYSRDLRFYARQRTAPNVGTSSQRLIDSKPIGGSVLRIPWYPLLILRQIRRLHNKSRFVTSAPQQTYPLLFFFRIALYYIDDIHSEGRERSKTGGAQFLTLLTLTLSSLQNMTAGGYYPGTGN